jgi:RNA polymerase sigma-70 factor (ECF subfamily)
MEQTITSDSDHAFEQVVHFHRSHLLRSAMSYTGSYAEAEDLVQETFFKAYRAFDRLLPGSDVRPWLSCILRNTFISAWRRRRRERAMLEPETCLDRAPWLAPRKLADEPGWGENEGLGDEVVRALEEVPGSYRTLLLLVDLHQKSYQEAADLTNQPLGTVQSRLFRGRRLLKTKLADYARREGYLAEAA